MPVSWTIHGSAPGRKCRFSYGCAVVDPLVKEKTLPTLAGNWREFLSSGDDKEVDALRIATRTGLPAGDEVFITELSKITGKNVMRGRPRRSRKKQKFKMV